MSSAKTRTLFLPSLHLSNKQFFSRSRVDADEIRVNRDIDYGTRRASPSAVADANEPRDDPETYAIIGAAMEVHRVLGCGFLEAMYRAALILELIERSIPVAREVPFRVH
mgnify:CR=1 FL=1